MSFLRPKGDGTVEKSDNITFTSQRIGNNDLLGSFINKDKLCKDASIYSKIEDIFIKNDQNKIQPSLIQPEFIEGMAKVLTLGAQKYSKDNWKKCEDKDRYKDALLRHVLAYLKGEEKDEESGLSHLHHAACNLMFLEFMK